MGINSMTGFGRGTVARGGYVVTVEVSAVNRKQFDLRLNAPRGLMVLEPQIGKVVRGSVSRGGVTVAVMVQQAAGGQVLPALDEACAGAYVAAARTLARQWKISEVMTAVELLRMPGVMQQAGGSEPDSAAVWPVVRDALKEALTAFLVMRKTEGEMLSRDMSKRLSALRRLKAKVQKRSPCVAQHYRIALRKRLEALLEAKADRALPESIAREVAIFADRCDISEELVRLDSHIDQAQVQLEGRGTAGRTLEFLCQEILREINTVGSKANDRHIAGWVVDMKSQLEALREQVQNVE